MKAISLQNNYFEKALPNKGFNPKQQLSTLRFDGYFQILHNQNEENSQKVQ